jgi:hypothetical protein
LCVCRFHLECETTVGNIVVWWMDPQWGIVVTFWNRPHRYDWTEWRSWWCVWTNCFQTFGNTSKWCQHTAAVHKDHSALPIHHCQSMKTYCLFLVSIHFETLTVLELVKLWRKLKLGSLLKLSGKIKYFDIPNGTLKWEKEVNLWASSYL